MNAVASRNVKFISHSDQGGRGDGVQIMVHRGYAYIGHGYSNGITVLDVRDPKNPRPVAFLPCPPDTRAIHLQTHDDLLLAVNGPSMWTMQVDAQAYYSGSPADLLKGRQYTPGIRVFDIAHPEAPREIAFRATEGVGPARLWYVGGRYAYVSIHYPEFTVRPRFGPRVGFCQGRPAVTGRVSGVSPAADAAGRRSAARRSACDTAAAAALVELAVPPVPARARGATPPVVRDSCGRDVFVHALRA